MPKRTTDYRSALLDDLKDPVEALHYLNAALRDSQEMFLLALRDVAESRQMAKVAEDAGVSRESLYRMLSPSGNPTYQNLFGILKALDIELGDLRPRSAPEGPHHQSGGKLFTKPAAKKQIVKRQRDHTGPRVR